MSISRIESIMALRAAETERHCERDSATPYAVEGVDIDRVERKMWYGNSDAAKNIPRPR